MIVTGEVTKDRKDVEERWTRSNVCWTRKRARPGTCMTLELGVNVSCLSVSDLAYCFGSWWSWATEYDQRFFHR